MERNHRDEIRTGSTVSEERISIFKKMRAKICHHCPVCSHARRNPNSKIGKILHHKYHAENCPMWNAEKEVYGEKRDTNSPEVKALMFWKAL